jgi:NAD+-dependent protein deacetylase sirtuin 2
VGACALDHVNADTPRLLINRERVGEAACSVAGRLSSRGFNFDDGYRDALFLGDCDLGVRQLCRHLGWESDLDRLIAEGSAKPEATTGDGPLASN